VKAMKMDKKEGKKHVEKAMEAIRKDSFIQKYVSNEMKCLKCMHASKKDCSIPSFVNM